MYNKFHRRIHIFKVTTDFSMRTLIFKSNNNQFNKRTLILKVTTIISTKEFLYLKLQQTFQ